MGTPRVIQAPLTTSLRGLWVSGNAGHRAMVERTKGRRPNNRPCDTKGRRPKNRPTKGGTLEATWVRGEGTREPWRRGATIFLQVVAATACATVTSSKPTPLGMGCLWSASGTGLLGPTSCTRYVPSVTVSSSTSWTTRQLYAVSLLHANAPGLIGGRGEMAIAVPCCPLRGSAACGSVSRLIGSLCHFKWAPTQSGGPWANQRAGRRSGASLDTTRPGFF